MPRKIYGHSDETRAVLSGFEGRIAREMECDETYIYGMKNAKEPDRYPRFREIFRASVHAGADVSPWLNDLNSIVAGVARTASAVRLADLFVQKLQCESLSNEEIIRDLLDGNLDERETDRLLDLMANIRQNERMITDQLLKQKAKHRGELRIA